MRTSDNHKPIAISFLFLFSVQALFQDVGDESLFVAQPECMLGVVDEVALICSWVNQHRQLPMVILIKGQNLGEQSRVVFPCSVQLPHGDWMWAHRVFPELVQPEIASFEFFGKFCLDLLSELRRLFLFVWVPVRVEVVGLDVVSHGD